MKTARLNDAALCLSSVLRKAGIRHGIFGGYAIAVLGGTRESKDVDCAVANVTKEDVVALLDGKHGFLAMPQTRDDYVAFIWSDRPDHSDAVLVEIFPERFTGAEYSMDGLRPEPRTVTGQNGLQGTTYLVDPFHLFIGKLGAAARRPKPYDATDLIWLESQYSDKIARRSDELSLVFIGMILRRYPKLEDLFRRVRVDVGRAQQMAGDVSLAIVPAPRGSVQLALLKNEKSAGATRRQTRSPGWLPWIWGGLFDRLLRPVRNPVAACSSG